MEDEGVYAFRAVFGNTTIKGQSFTGVGDALTERGFDMTKARATEDGLSVPHTLPRRRPAKVWFERADVQVEAKPDPPEIERMYAAYRAVYSGEVVPGLQTRPCGSLHSDGVVCLIPVMFEALHCGCGDMTFPHDGPHESVDETGVRYRWEEILVIQDMEFDTYTSGQVSA
ncbi:MAG: hypothetical protein WCJ18_00170 [Planctomycetota bacterium]